MAGNPGVNRLPHKIAVNQEINVFHPLCPAQFAGRNPYDFAAHIKSWPAAVARVGGCVGLQPIGVTGGEDAARDGQRLQPQRIAEDNQVFPYRQVRRAAKADERVVVTGQLEYRQVQVGIVRHDRRRHLATVMGTHGRLTRASNDMAVRYHIAIRCHHEAAAATVGRPDVADGGLGLTYQFSRRQWRAGRGRCAAERPSEQALYIAAVVSLARAFGRGTGAERALVDAHVAGVGQVAFDSVIEVHAGGRPLGGRRACRRSAVQCPGEHRSYVVAMIVLTRVFGLTVKRPLVDAHVPGVAEVMLDDVVEVHAGAWPLRVRWRGQRHRTDHRDQEGDQHPSGGGSGLRQDLHEEILSRTGPTVGESDGRGLQTHRTVRESYQ